MFSFLLKLIHLRVGYKKGKSQPRAHVPLSLVVYLPRTSLTFDPPPHDLSAARLAGTAALPSDDAHLSLLQWHRRLLIFSICQLDAPHSCVCLCVCLSDMCSVTSDSLRPHGLYSLPGYSVWLIHLIPVCVCVHVCVCLCVCLCACSINVWLLATPRTVACQVTLSGWSTSFLCVCVCTSVCVCVCVSVCRVCVRSRLTPCDPRTVPGYSVWLIHLIPVCVCLCVLSHVWLLATPWMVARQAPGFMQCPRHIPWSGSPSPTQGNFPALPDVSPARQAASSPVRHPESPYYPSLVSAWPSTPVTQHSPLWPSSPAPQSNTVISITSLINCVLRIPNSHICSLTTH